MKRYLQLVTLGLLFVASNLNATTYTTKNDGDWSNNATWVGSSAPSFSPVDSIYINHEVNYGNNQVVIFDYMQITATGRLYTGKNKALTIHQYATVDNYGEVDIPNLINSGTLNNYNDFYAESFTNQNLGIIHIHTGAYFESEGQVSNSGIIYNDGTLFSPSIFVNNGGTISGDGGTYLVDHNFINNASAYITCSGENGISICTSYGAEPSSIVSSSGYIDSSCVTICGRSLSSGAALPITLVSFDAEVTKENIVNLSWVTATEINNDYFEIERSTDGSNFTAIQIIDGAGNSTVTLSYTSQDNNALQGTTYYRLKQTDFDGKTSYSSIVAVSNNVSATMDYTVFPNPSNGSFNVQVKNVTSSEVTISMYNTLGQLTTQKTYVAEPGITNIYSIRTSDEVAAGTYYLEVVTGEQTKVQTITIQ